MFENLADLNDNTIISGVDLIGNKWSVKLTWGKLFSIISPFLLTRPADEYAEKIIAEKVYSLTGKTLNARISIDEEIFQTIKIHFSALKLIELKFTKTTTGGQALFWFLTQQGGGLMMELRSVKKDSTSS